MSNCEILKLRLREKIDKMCDKKVLWKLEKLNNPNFGHTLLEVIFLWNFPSISQMSDTNFKHAWSHRLKTAKRPFISLWTFCSGNHSRIKALVGPRHFFDICRAKIFFRVYLLHFDLNRPLFPHFFSFVGPAPFYQFFAFVGPFTFFGPRHFA